MKNLSIYALIGMICFYIGYQQPWASTNSIKSGERDTVIIMDTIRLAPITRWLIAKKETIEVRIVDSILVHTENKDSLIVELLTPFSISDSTKDFKIDIIAMPIERIIIYRLDFTPIEVEKTIIIEKIVDPAFSFQPYLIGMGIGVLLWEIIR